MIIPFVDLVKDGTRIARVYIAETDSLGSKSLFQAMTNDVYLELA